MGNETLESLNKLVISSVNIEIAMKIGENDNFTEWLKVENYEKRNLFRKSRYIA
jgi:hypothetical protein